jgi:Prokaryotic N-terminal methylation motif
MRSRSRGGFTLIELMVAMALTMFVMVILSQAFVLSLETFSNMTGIGTMVSNLRTAEVLLRDDLSQDHFEGKRRLSDMNAAGGHQIVVAPPEAGFVAVRQASAASNTAGAPYFYEGNDANGLPSYRATDHCLHLTSKRRGNRPENFYTAALLGGANILPQFFGKQTAYNILPVRAPGSPTPNLPDSTYVDSYISGAPNAFYSSQWAEIVYYLVRTGSTEEANNPNAGYGAASTPLYSLYRAQFVMVPDSTNVNTLYAGAIVPAALNTFSQMSCNVGVAGPAPLLQFYSPTDAAKGQRMVPDLATFTSGKPLAAFNAVEARVHLNATLVVPNVISFEVQTMRLNENAFSGYGGTNMSPYYDTTKFNVVGAAFPNTGLKAIQATIRVWDTKTRQTRQVTVVQDM